MDSFSWPWVVDSIHRTVTVRVLTTRFCTGFIQHGSSIVVGAKSTRQKTYTVPSASSISSSLSPPTSSFSAPSVSPAASISISNVSGFRISSFPVWAKSHNKARSDYVTQGHLLHGKNLKRHGSSKPISIERGDEVFLSSYGNTREAWLDGWLSTTARERMNGASRMQQTGLYPSSRCTSRVKRGAEMNTKNIPQYCE